MRRSICYCEPSAALAGETSTWKFIYTTANHLPKGAKIRFDMESRGRAIDWQVPHTNLKDKKNLIWLEIPGHKDPIAAVQTQNTQASAAMYVFTIPLEMKPGDSFSIHLNASPCQKLVQRKKPFPLFIDPKGKGEFKDPETFHLDVRGNQLAALRILAPSVVNRNKRFDVIVRFEDIFGNLTANAPEGTLIDLSYQHLRENLNWKLFVPETGFIALPNLYFNEPGVYTIQLRNLKTNQTFFSPPIKCLSEGSLNLYWGILHGESDRVDATESIDALLRHIRDDKALQFYSLSPFDSEEETSNDLWKSISQHIAEFNEDERFVAFAGFQWLGEPGEEGLRHFVYAKDGKPILRKKDTKNNSLKKIFKTNNPKEMIAIPSFSMGKKTLYNFEDFNFDFERVAEIYNAWGSSECTEKDGNLRPIKGDKRTIAESSEGSLVKALNRGRRFGFVAGGYDDRGCYRDCFSSGQSQYSPGLTAILAKAHTRTSLIEALQARSCYATTGERMILGLHLAGFPMGSVIDTKTRPGLEFNRHITGYCIGTKPLAEVSLIRNGIVLSKIPFKENLCEFEIDDKDVLGSVVLESSNEQPPFAYYYIRAIQEDGHTAWSSPIWVDLTLRTVSLPIKKGKKKTTED